MCSGDKTEFINRLETPDLTNWNGRIFSRRDQIQVPMDEVLIEEVASQQQTLALAEGPLQDMTVTFKQYEITFVFTKGEQQFCHGEKWRNQRDARHAGNGYVKNEQKQPAIIDSRIVHLGLNSKLQQLYGPCVKHDGQKLETLMREVGCKHEERSNAN